jgi:hypothetical protein
MYTPLLKCSKLLLFIAISISITKYVYTQSIISTSPIANQINVDPSSNILIEFDCSIDKESITNNSFVVYGTQTGLRNGSFSYDDSAKVVTYVPDKRFFNGENVRVILTREILTSLGDSLSNSYHFSFTIKSTWGGSSFQEKIDYDTEYRPISLVSADFDQDNDLDVAVVNFGFLSRSISVYMNDGSGAFINKTDYPTGDDPYFISSADFDRDGDMDLVVINNYWIYDLSIFLNNGAGLFDVRRDYIPSSGGMPNSSLCDDFNDDGYLDIGITYAFDDSVGILLNNQKGEFYTKKCYETGDSPWSLFSLDIENDYDIDLAVANWLSTPLSILPNINNGRFGPKREFGIPSSGSCVYAADLDSDRDMDLLVANEGRSNVSVYMNNGSGDFSSRTEYGSLLSTTSVSVADFNGDGYLDFVANGHGDPNHISIFNNRGDGTFNHYSDHVTGAGPKSIFCGDFDSDGDMDIVLTNFYSNTFSIFKKVEGANCVSSKNELPKSILLEQNYPNPFNPSTIIRYALPIASDVRIDIYNVLGEYVATIVNGHYPIGLHEVKYNARHLSTGYYIYRIQAGKFQDVKKMILQK